MSSKATWGLLVLLRLLVPTRGLFLTRWWCVLLGAACADHCCIRRMRRGGVIACLLRLRLLLFPGE
jgi:hypothetical protein